MNNTNNPVKANMKTQKPKKISTQSAKNATSVDFKNKINSFLSSKLLAAPDSAKLKTLLMRLKSNNYATNAKLSDDLMLAQSNAQKLGLQSKKTQHDEKAKFFNKLDSYLLSYAKTHKAESRAAYNNSNKPLQTMQNLENGDSITSEVNGIMKELVNTMGKDSPAAKQARADLNGLIKKYPNKLPDAITNIVMTKLKKNGLGVIFGVQSVSTLLALLISLIPIPEIGVLSDVILGTSDAFTDFVTFTGPENINDFLKNGIKNGVKDAADLFKQEMLPVLKEVTQIMGESIATAMGARQQLADKNMERFGELLGKLIKLLDDGPTKNSEVKELIDDIRNNVLKTKTVKSINMNALDKIINKSNISSPQKSNMQTTDNMQSQATPSIGTKNPQKNNKKIGGTKKRRKNKRRITRKQRKY